MEIVACTENKYKTETSKEIILQERETYYTSKPEGIFILLATSGTFDIAWRKYIRMFTLGQLKETVLALGT